MKPHSRLRSTVIFDVVVYFDYKDIDNTSFQHQFVHEIVFIDLGA